MPAATGVRAMPRSDAMPPRRFSAFAPLAAALALAACGGGGDSTSDPATPPAPALTDAQRSAAATATANSASNTCAAIAPFYWEVGDVNSRIASGSVTSATDPTVMSPAR